MINIDTQTCLKVEPGRGDCEHFSGIPTNETAMNKYGRPQGWCEICWRGYRLKEMSKALGDAKAVFQFYQTLTAQDFIAELIYNDAFICLKRATKWLRLHERIVCE